jgi:hypothetical protein
VWGGGGTINRITRKRDGKRRGKKNRKFGLKVEYRYAQKGSDIGELWKWARSFWKGIRSLLKGKMGRGISFSDGQLGSCTSHLSFFVLSLAFPIAVRGG